jgi:hypothetical protein
MANNLDVTNSRDLRRQPAPFELSCRPRQVPWSRSRRASSTVAEKPSAAAVCRQLVAGAVSHTSARGVVGARLGRGQTG